MVHSVMGTKGTVPFGPRARAVPRAATHEASAEPHAGRHGRGHVGNNPSTLHPKVCGRDEGNEKGSHLCYPTNPMAMTERFVRCVPGQERGRPLAGRCLRWLTRGVHSSSRNLNGSSSGPVGKPSVPRHGTYEWGARTQNRCAQPRWYRGSFRPWGCANAQLRGRFLL